MRHYPLLRVFIVGGLLPWDSILTHCKLTKLRNHGVKKRKPGFTYVQNRATNQETKACQNWKCVLRGKPLSCSQVQPSEADVSQAGTEFCQFIGMFWIGGKTGHSRISQALEGSWKVFLRADSFPDTVSVWLPCQQIFKAKLGKIRPMRLSLSLHFSPLPFVCFVTILIYFNNMHHVTLSDPRVSKSLPITFLLSSLLHFPL